jgi:acetyl/propionyl-CoA carboxylase alpha subunit
MDPHALELLVDGDAADGWVVRSSSVGVWSVIPEDGAIMEGTGVGVLTQGNRRIVLRLPVGVRGTVRDSPRASRRSVAVEWGQVLFRLEPLGESATVEHEDTVTSANAAGIFPAPTDGVYYTRPTPTAEPFVKPGDTLRNGQPVGLIEVMKTFNQILFESDGLPEPAVVEELLVGDGEEVRAGDGLLRIKNG